MNFFNDDRKGIIDLTIFIFLSIIVCLLIVVIYRVYKIKYDKECPIVEEEIVKEENVALEEVVVVPEEFYVDIKGAVVNPGVYLVNKDNIVNDVVNLAGGFKNGAYTKNINLSKKVSKEMVIIIYLEKDIKNQVIPQKECVCNEVNINTCVDNNASIVVPGKEENKKEEVVNEVKEEVSEGVNKVNINKASTEELQKLNGIGEAKAKAIVEYRNSNGEFKSIEDVKNVTGISDSIYEKIKNDITI